MHILVMGGTQFNGLSLVHELHRRGHAVTVCNRGRSAADLPADIERLVADRTDHEALGAALGGRDWDAVVDMSAYHPPDVSSMIELLEGRCGHYVFASSTVVYAASDILPITEDHPDERGPDQNEYGLHKLQCEDLLLAAHAARRFPATTVAFSMVFGPHNTIRDREQRMFARMLAGRPVLVPGDGMTLLQIGHVDDQSRAIASLLGHEVTHGRRYNLTGSQAITRSGYVRHIAEALGVPDRSVAIPAELMDELWRGERTVGDGRTDVGMNIRPSAEASTNPRADLLRRRFQLAQLVQHLAPNIHWWNRSTVFSIDRLRRDIDWEPDHDVVSMIAQTWDWFERSGLSAEVDAIDWSFEDRMLELVGSDA